jgi:hypothetical protein
MNNFPIKIFNSLLRQIIKRATYCLTVALAMRWNTYCFNRLNIFKEISNSGTNEREFPLLTIDSFVDTYSKNIKF